MNTPANWIRRHQIISFFILTFVITWGLWIPFMPLVFGQEMYWLLPILMIGLFGPALAGIIISSITHSGPRLGRRKARWLAFFITWLLATPVFIFDPNRQGVETSVALIIISAVIGFIPAYVISSAFSRNPGVRKYLESLVKPRGSFAWYLIAILLIPSMLTLGILISRILGFAIAQSLAGDGFRGVDLANLVLLSAASRFFFANAVGEEPGWRGFALPRLQAEFNPLIANLILAFFWALWHLPLPQSQNLIGLGPFLNYYWNTFLHSLILTWLYNHSRGSILVAGLLHLSSNISRTFMPTTSAFDFIRPIFCVLIISLDRMWKKLPADSPGVYRANG